MTQGELEVIKFLTYNFEELNISIHDSSRYHEWFQFQIEKVEKNASQSDIFLVVKSMKPPSIF